MAHPTPELSRPVIADTVTPTGTTVRIDAGEAERRALARRFNLVSLDRLVATVRLRRVRGEFVRATGELEADVGQTCVVTLEPFTETLRDEFAALYAPAHLMPKDEEEDIDASMARGDDEDEVMDAIIGGAIDVGELVAQHLSLALPPYPRKPGVDYVEIVEAEDGAAPEETEEKPNPFAALARLKKPT